MKGQQRASGAYPIKIGSVKTNTSRVAKKGGAKKAGSKRGYNPTRSKTGGM